MNDNDGYDSDLEVDEALDLVEAIKDLIDEEVPDDALRRGQRFFRDVYEKAGDVGRTIEETGRVTPRQLQALKGWEAGVRKWIRSDQ